VHVSRSGSATEGIALARALSHPHQERRGDPDASRPIDELAAELILRCGGRDLPLQHYLRDRLFSTAARTGWLPPDTPV
jgi:hypothetical protein